MKTSYTTEELVKKLAEANIVVKPYARNPLPGAGLILNPGTSGKEIRVFCNPKIAKIKINLSKQFNQAVLNIIEPKRIITRTADVKHYCYNDTIETVRKAVEKRKSYLSVVIPGNFKITGKITKKGEKDLLNCDFKLKHGSFIFIQTTFTAVIPKTELNILLGKDDNAHFVCAIPKKVNSVKEARRSLRPDNVPPGSKRQGEFFFVPVNMNENDINNIVQFKNASFCSDIHRALEKFSTHTAQEIILFNKTSRFYKKMIVKGKIKDRRKGRHHTLMLNSWHQVIRNKEIVIPFEEQLKNRYWD